MIRDDTYLYHWSIQVQGREFMIGVFLDGTMEWHELAAIHRAGGRGYTNDAIGGLLGDQKSSRRVGNLWDEFKIVTPADTTATPIFEHAGSLDEEDPLPDGLEDMLDRIFFEQFWEHVNPNLPDPLTK